MGHTVVPSAPLPMKDNPTLFFTNAGMNQFVDTFLGKEQRPYRRAASSQKCMRVQGKHNDLENVGPSPRHHTFFEMLGNFSFGDYFKSGAIRYAYDFLTRVCQIPEDKFWFTVHTEDDHAYQIWVDEMGVDPARVLRMGDKTNFWMMGEVGPCGPTSELHYDWGAETCTCGRPDCGVLLDNGCDRWLEVWNLVFMQYNRDENGVRTPLPSPGVDTGMGLERITSVQQQRIVNYETDLFASALDRVQQLLGDSDEQRRAQQVGYRVIADHARAATFLIGDGVLPGNIGGGYVLRMIIRRAARFGRSIGFQDPFMAEIAETFIEEMGEVYPELVLRRDFIKHTLQVEEERFARTLDSALAQLDAILELMRESGRRDIPGEVAFNLYATHGLPLEITRDVVGEQGLTVDEAGYQLARDAHAAASGAGAFSAYETQQNVYSSLLQQLILEQQLGPNGVQGDPYSGSSMSAPILAILRQGEPVREAFERDQVEIITAATPFYVEGGGEVSDTGWIVLEGVGAARIDDVIEPLLGLIVHVGEMTAGSLSVGAEVQLIVDDARRADIRRNHTATHLLHKELRRHLGSHVAQAGSLVAPDRLRFDFTHSGAVGSETLAEIERAINERIVANETVTITYMDQREAIGDGAMALFGEKYGDVVRTVRIGDLANPYSFELCGGLHVSETNDIGAFRFTGEGAVGAGVRRVEAVTGRKAYDLVSEKLALLERVARRLNTPVGEIEARLETLLAEQRQLQKEIERLRQENVLQQVDLLLGKTQEVAGVPVLAAVVVGADADALRAMTDHFRASFGSGVAVLGTVNEDRPVLVAAVTPDLIQRGLRAGDLIKKVAQIVGGSGGGRPHLAQAGGRDPDRLPAAIEAVPDLVREALS
jgi:alanyl-tRNA synthetase